MSLILSQLPTFLLIAANYILVLAIMWRLILREDLQPPTRLAWIMVVALVPALGSIAYVLIGEVRLHRTEKQKLRDIETGLGIAWGPIRLPAHTEPAIAPSFALGRALSGFPPVLGNRAVMLPEDDSCFDDMIATIDAAQDHVHLLFYIWMPDTTGTRMAEAAIRAAARGVTVRVLVDDLGSRRLVRSPLWREMQEAGVACARAEPIGNPFTRLVYKRLDLRNHRKIIVVDNVVTWTGSRNCADAAFQTKAKFAPWVDILIRVEGPVVRQFQAVFLRDWMLHSDEDVTHLLADAPEAVPATADADRPAHILPFKGQVLASGPDQMTSGMSETICALLYAAQDSVTITTPYFLPDQAVQAAICACARRGVMTVLILPEHNDSRLIGAASEGFYHALVEAGVQLRAFRHGLLHSKIITVDGQFGMIGSANLDRRSFDLNYECNLLFHSTALTTELDRRQGSYLARSRPISAQEVAGWSVARRVYTNALSLAGPLL